ncbi:MAG: chromosome segregation protein SMC [Clostridiales bacterium]|nr:chromosome segregation protein SMC [Clostridiales bacterium]
MKLTRLEIYGFKSFPQRTDIRFDDGITGIVGPNGSGKSNIADAVRWVLGEQSAKALRGSRMEDVIFAGTQKRRPMPYCEVSLIFDNEDGQLKSPQTEVMVTRRAYRSGEGEYYLNKKTCRLRDIVELFHDTGIGREGYSIIGQGNIDVILSGRGDERRAAFEEAAGIIGYRSRKEEAERKLNRTQENLLRVGDLLEELGSRIEPLREQSEAARAYMALSARLKTLDANIYLTRHDRLTKRLQSLKETQQGMRELIAQHELDIAGYQEQRKELEARLFDAEQAADAQSDLLARQETALREQLVQVERSAQVLENAREELKKNEEELHNLKKELEELDSLRSQTAQDEAHSDSLLKDADKVLAGLEQAARDTQEKQTAVEERLDAHRSLILQSANSRADARERQARQQAMLQQSQARMQEIEQGEDGLKTAVALAEQAEAAALKQLEVTQAAVNALREGLAQTELALKTAREQAAGAQNELIQAQQAFQRDTARYNTMEELARAHEGFFQPVRQALKYGENNPKVHGAVAHLIQVPKELETAMEMVLGGALQNVVTQDEETAQELIQYLRENRFGRTTFLPISAVRGRSLSANETHVLKLPGCLGVASQLIAYDSQYQGIIESLLGRTVVARDLDAAIAISRAGRQAFNVVTLMGDVMRAGGAMTGGSVQSRTVSLLGREREMKELAASLNEQAERLQTMQATLVTLKDQAAQLEEQVHRERLHTQDEEIGIAREEEQVKQTAERLQVARERLDQSMEARAQLQEMIAELQEDLSQADAASRQIDHSQEHLAAQEAGMKEELAQAREAAEAARLQMEQQREACSQLAHRLDLFKRDNQRFEKERHALSTKSSRLQQLGIQLAQRIQEEGKRQEEIADQAKAFTRAVEDIRSNAAQAEADRRALNATQRQLVERSEQAHRSHSEDSQKLHKSEISLTRLEEELHAMTATLFHTHELTYASAEAFKTEEKFDLPAGEREAADIRKEIRDMGAINIHALEEYAQTKSRFDELSLQKEDAEKAREDLQSLIKRLQGQMEKQFLREFALLNEYFGETFKRLFNGGQASLSLADPSQPLDCEIQIKAQPPGKKLQLLSLLSGGERTLTAISILFAMLKLKPTPFCILDEIEAALDDANIYSFAEYLAEYAKGTQFIVITHRKGTMESCDMLYGVTMREKGVSDMIAVNLQEYTA